MSRENKAGQNNRKTNGKSGSKRVKHNPQDESARAKFGLQSTTSNGDRKAGEIRN